MSYKPRKWKFRVKHILDAMARIESYTIGHTYVTFTRDEKTVDAVILKLAVIGEAARHIPSEIQARHPEIPWRKIQGLRNVIVHEYDRINLEVVWNVIHQDLPPLAPLLTDVLIHESGE
jgi:uncharacterized protein with HEPN domain